MSICELGKVSFMERVSFALGVLYPVISSLITGEHLVIAVSNDPKFPHASYKCELCDCYFNDEYARKAHVKGRRHRLNYKKTHDPSLYVEPTKAMVCAGSGPGGEL